MAKISDQLTNGDALLELGNRADLSAGAPSKLARWYAKAYLSIGMGYPLEPLESTYISGISNTDVMAFPATSRAIKSLVYTDSTGTVIEPDFKDIRYIRRMVNTTPSRASVYCVYGSNIIFRPAFDGDNYTITLDTWEKPTITANVVDTVLLVPDDWLEALDYSVVLRGFSLLGEVDKARMLREYLFGYTNPQTGQYVAGLLSQLTTRAQANSPVRDYGIQPRGVKQGYTK